MKDHYHHGNLRCELIDSAIAILSEEGLEALSLRKAAARCGVSHNAVYRHFESKEQLLCECRRYVTELLTQRLSDSVRDEASPAGELRKMSVAYVTFYKENPSYYSFLYRNSSVPLDFTGQNTTGNYPPLVLFSAVCQRIGEKNGWTEAEIAHFLIQHWALLHGLTALALSSRVVWNNEWEKILEEITI